MCCWTGRSWTFPAGTRAERAVIVSLFAVFSTCKKGLPCWGVPFVRLCSPRQFEQGAEVGGDLALLFGRLILEPADDVKQAAPARFVRVFAKHQLIQ